MATDPGRRYGFLQDIALIAVANIGIYYVIRYAFARLDTIGESKEQSGRKAAAQANLKRIEESRKANQKESENDDNRSTRKEDLLLNQYEQMIALEAIAPEDIPISFKDIGGLEDVIDDLRESVIYPLMMPHLYSRASSLLSAPSGVLLYGPPGCGKTLLAKALAAESGAAFINLHISTLTEKWYGDSNKIVNAVFTLARKMQPTIVFIDEIDAVLGTRRSGEHEASGMVKAEFMTHWDGLTSSNTFGEPQRILILGATNRMQDIDEAILRRMPKKFPVSKPSASQRLQILGLVLKDTKVDKEHFDLELLVRVMAGMSGSDIKEACRDAAMMPVREYMKQKRASGARMDAMDPHEIRGLRTEDFFASTASLQPTSLRSGLSSGPATYYTPESESELEEKLD
ncbi:hypothetical protein MMC25_001893 [Agyrium rufum]|nr:hypothetical protein [Agyrium rufum]